MYVHDKFRFMDLSCTYMISYRDERDTFGSLDLSCMYNANKRHTEITQSQKSALNPTDASRKGTKKLAEGVPHFLF